MKVFVTGGAGFIGSRVCRLLLERNDQVVVLVRAADSIAAPSLAGAELVVGDLEDIKLLEHRAYAANAVLHLALAAGERAGVVDRGAIEAFKRALAKTDRPFVHTSAAGIVGDTHGSSSTRGTPRNRLRQCAGVPITSR